MKKTLYSILCLLLISTLIAQPALAVVSIQSGATSDNLTIDTNKNARVAPGASTRATYVISTSGLATTAAFNLSIEASAGTGYKLAEVCVAFSNATAAAAATITVQRRSTASSGGTACTAEGTTANCVMSKYDPADGNYGGAARTTATLGTAGAILDQWGVQVGVVSSGNIPAPWCKKFGENGGKMPTVVSGTANGLSINVSSQGAGGLADGAISATIIAE